jgi:hypothetical protein
MGKYSDELPFNAVLPCRPWGGYAVNMGVSTTAHRDRDKGVCFVGPFGNWRGGELVLFEYGLIVEHVGGAGFFFQSSSCTHFNLHFEGTRGSVVFHTDREATQWNVDRNGWADQIE